MIRFDDPWVLALLALLPLGVWLRARWHRRRAGTLTYPALDTVARAGGGAHPWLPRIPAILRVLALALLIVALARPQAGISGREVRTEGIDIMLVLDLSTSMQAEDLQPNRIDAAKAMAARFVAGRRNDRVGLVAFAGQAFTQAPLTIDHGVILSLLDDLEVGMIEDGTAVGMGLATAVKRLQASEAASRIAILLTDGRSNRGEIGPLTAAQAAEALGVKVYAIGVGSRGTARVPVQNSRGQTRYATMQVDIDEETLQQIAERTGGLYFRATDNQSLSQIYQQIDELERTEIEVLNYTRYEELFGILAILGLLLLTLDVALSQTLLRRLP